MSTTTTQLEPARAPETIELETSRPAQGPTPPGDEQPAEEKLDRKMIFKLCSAAFCFYVAGVNDGSLGALVPYIIREHDINTAIVSSV